MYGCRVLSVLIYRNVFIANTIARCTEDVQNEKKATWLKQKDVWRQKRWTSREELVYFTALFPLFISRVSTTRIFFLFVCFPYTGCISPICCLSCFSYLLMWILFHTFGKLVSAFVGAPCQNPDTQILKVYKSSHQSALYEFAARFDKQKMVKLHRFLTATTISTMKSYIYIQYWYVKLKQ